MSKEKTEDWGIFEKTGFNVLNKNSNKTIEPKEAQLNPNLKLIFKHLEPSKNIETYSKVGQLFLQVEGLKIKIKSLEAQNNEIKQVPKPIPVENQKEKRKKWSWEDDPETKKSQKTLRSWEIGLNRK